ncbi:MAG: hypothetical protein B6U65_04890 [Candidatus Wolframiiraptor sp. EX4484-121]|nr:MAG: hypothetical protein B6U65_04890 [Candidatus Wolframiiraptor sp. EX4484-121]
MAFFAVNIPRERVGVLIGPKGSVKRRIEDELGVRLTIDSEGGSVRIELKKPPEEGGDPVALFKARDVVEAIGRGFSIYGDTVAIIGSEEDVRAAEEAVISIINGAPHAQVYRRLNEYARMRKLGGLRPRI